MSDLIGLGVIAVIILSAIGFLYYLSRPYEVTPEEFEKRAQEAPSLISAGFLGLQKILEPATKRAIEVQEDFRAGRYNKDDESGDPPEPGEEERKK